MKIKLKNRLEVLMKDSGINTFEEMSERLTQNQDWKISRSALSRKFRDENPTLSLEMIEAICNELQCLPGDLFETNVTDATEEEINAIQSRVQPFRYGMLYKSLNASNVAHKEFTKAEAEQNSNADDDIDFESILGPKVSHLHAGKVKKDH
jgi:DNA-binding Xre family transcriptional regulator